MKTKIFIGHFLTIFFLFSHNIAYGGIGINPPYNELNGKAGGKVYGVWEVINSSDFTMIVDVYYRDLYVLDENKEFSVNNWLKTHPMRFRLEPNERKDVRYIVKIPEDAIGELMGMVYFSAPSGLDSNVRMSLGAALYTRVEGTEKIKAEISGIYISKVEVPGAGFKPYYGVKVDIRNEGNVHIRPRINLEIYKGKGLVIEREFPYGWPVFPRLSHIYNDTWEKEDFEFKPGSYEMLIKVSFYDCTLTKRAWFRVGKDGEVRMIKRTRGG